MADEPVPSTKLTSPTLCDSSVTQHAGYLDVALGTKYFFWMFESRSGPKSMSKAPKTQLEAAPKAAKTPVRSYRKPVKG